MINLQSLSSSQLRKVAAIKEQIEKLEAELADLAGGAEAPAAPAAKKLGRPPGRPPGKPLGRPPGGRRKMSAEAKARIAAAQRARWAKVHAAAGKTAAKPATAAPKRRKMSPAARAKLAAIAKARWAKAKASGKSVL